MSHALTDPATKGASIDRRAHAGPKLELPLTIASNRLRLRWSPRQSDCACRSNCVAGFGHARALGRAVSGVSVVPIAICEECPALVSEAASNRAIRRACNGIVHVSVQIDQTLALYYPPEILTGKLSEPVEWMMANDETRSGMRNLTQSLNQHRFGDKNLPRSEWPSIPARDIQVVFKTTTAKSSSRI